MPDDLLRTRNKNTWKLQLRLVISVRDVISMWNPIRTNNQGSRHSIWKTRSSQEDESGRGEEIYPNPQLTLFK